MSAREDLNRLKQYLGISTDRELADILGTNKTNIDSWVKRGKIPDKWSIIIGQMYHNNKNNNIDIPLVKLIAGAGSGVQNFDLQQSIVSLDPNYFNVVTTNSMLIEVTGDSMEPDVLDGDVVIVSPVGNNRITEDGIYAIRIDNMIMIKNLHFRLDGKIDIISSNKKYPIEQYDPSQSQVDFQVIGRKVLRITRQ